MCRAISVMEAYFIVVLIFISGLSRTVAFKQVAANKSVLKTYIVHVNEPEGEVSAIPAEDLESWYRTFLPAGTDQSTDGRQRLLYSYRHVLRGFAARLTEEEVKEMEKKDGFVSAAPEKIYHLQTTRTPNFLGLHNSSGFWKESNYGEGVIIGVLDTGVYPEHPSFLDEGMPPPPAKWKGACEFNGMVCNNKLIGAKNFDSSTVGFPPIDEDGHGTHTASTAAGNFVVDANLDEVVIGNASGIAPRAHLAVYMVCRPLGCAGSDILAAFDAAIEDGVDVLSLSAGGDSAPFHKDPIALGSFAAIRKGIFVSCAAGNRGPAHSTLSNEAPWILTVAASTLDRKLTATAKLGNMEEFDGETVYQPSNFSSKLLPLVYSTGPNGDTFCSAASIGDVRGKVVVCDRGGNVSRTSKGAAVQVAGGAAMILVNGINDSYSVLADVHYLPATHLTYEAGLKVKAYIKSTSNPTATILFKGSTIGHKSAPEITSFSSRGPSLASPGILKPDITGPGVNIMAAWPRPLLNVNLSTMSFSMISGTSMSCPHLSGVAALVKSAHPNWSPAAIKSAIMTTADTMNLKGQPILDEKHLPADLFAVGAGHVNPSKANDPGLVYDNEPADYVPYFCGLGYSDAQVGAIISRKVNCSKESRIPEAELNYPSFSIALGSEVLKFTRVVTNVGKPDSSYTVEIDPPKGVEVVVKPEKIHFSKTDEKKSYTVSFKKASGNGSKNGYAQGSLKWVSSTHSVRSPISVSFE